MPTLSQLLQPRSSDQILASLITYLQGKGYAPTDWVSGSEQRTLIELEAAGLADMEALRVSIAQGGFVDTAQGDFLDLVGLNVYSLGRKLATFARQTFRFTAQAGFGPYTLQPNQLWAGSGNIRFNNLAGGTLNAGGTLDLEFKAESPGTAYNLALGTAGTLFTPLPGVTISNVTVLENAIDREADEVFRARLKLRWGELGYGATKAAYQSWALNSDVSITKVNVLDQNPRGQGTVDVVVWGEGGIGAGAVTNANNYIQLRKPLTSNVQVYAATAVNIAVTATIKLKTGYLTQTQAEVSAKLSAFQRALGIGATVFRSAIIEALFGTYVVDVALSAPAADTVLTNVQVATFTLNATYIEV